MTDTHKPSATAAADVGYFTCAIPDMECAGCAATVEKAVQEQDGILDLSLNLIGQRAKVRFDPEVIDSKSIAAAIRSAGYQVEMEPSLEEERETPFWKDSEKILTLLSGCFFFIGLGIEFLFKEESHAPFWQGHLGLADTLLIIAALIGGFNFFPAGLRALRHLSLDMNFLMTAAIVGALIIGEYVEAAAIAFLFSTAELLEDYAIDRVRNSLRTLTKLAPETAVVRRNGQETVLPAREVSLDEIVLVRPGDKIPVDGVVIKGASAVDQSTITGESMPVSKKEEDRVFAGTINQEGYLEVKTTQVATETALGKIIQMVEEAEERKAPSEQFVRRFARYYTPIVTLLAVGIMIAPPLLLDASFSTWFVRGLTLLVIACPCALIISTPVAVVSAITSAARNGVLIKGGSYLEASGEIDVVAFDKTGTLTHGKPEVTDIVSLNGLPDGEILRIAAAVEKRSQHPIARAIVKHAKDAELPEVHEFTSIAGKGVRARINGDAFLVGRADLFAHPPAACVDSLAREGKSVVLVGTDSEIIGAIAVADTVRATAVQTVQKLHSRGLKVVMLTGDNATTARAIARELQVDEWKAELLPQQKVEQIAALSKRYGKVAMVGDGVNDAPALAIAAVGIAMGAIGSDAALETADIALMGDDLTKLPYLFQLSKTARRVIRQNVWTSILIKLGLALGVFPGLVSLAVAVLVGDMGTSLGVTGNALRLSRVD